MASLIRRGVQRPDPREPKVAEVPLTEALAPKTLSKASLNALRQTALDNQKARAHRELDYPVIG